ncbi:unnamed protein product [Acanthoscelides obtectus]|uniref:Uncharacterized protein n=1 Tax=Acanthoscelides obtectus TaxID=200917 RepID=A0A9P0KI56_ACAOB|nr:unnamed protein product [Acanthoscelides obtectus]CAK1676462.1 hypothetical protein AOBTE_LOCUS30772 [Acanthoscelides obtectus]
MYHPLYSGTWLLSKQPSYLLTITQQVVGILLSNDTVMQYHQAINFGLNNSCALKGSLILGIHTEKCILKLGQRIIQLEITCTDQTETTQTNRPLMEDRSNFLRLDNSTTRRQ